MRNKERTVKFMYTKKIAAAALLAAYLLTLSSCGKNSTEGTASAAGSETTGSETTAAVTTTAEATDEATAGTENNDAEVTENTEEEGNDTEAVNPLMDIADAAISVSEWPSLWEVTDKQLISDYFTLDADNANYKKLLVLQCPMSANLSEIIIIEADDVNAAKEDLEARREKAQTMDAFYPDDVERAGASIVGTEGNYAYFLMGTPAAEAETAVVDYIKGMN